VLPGIDPAFKPYYRDIVDHVNRALEQIDTLRETLTFAFEASLLFESSRQGEVGRRSPAGPRSWPVPTAIAGIYGMNFEHMPELKWRFGYPLVLTVITTVCVVLYLRFRKADGSS
jgi:magnesium transporter